MDIYKIGEKCVKICNGRKNSICLGYVEIYDKLISIILFAYNKNIIYY